jgi:hypothetical protein
MAKFNEEYFKAVLSMIQVTPENYRKLRPEIIRDLYSVVAQAQIILKKRKSPEEPEPSVYEGKTAKQIKERMTI